MLGMDADLENNSKVNSGDESDAERSDNWEVQAIAVYVNANEETTL